MPKKTLEQVKKEIEKQGYGDVYTISQFVSYLSSGFFIPYDGSGYFHDGENETEISVFSPYINFYDACSTYPYVCWYNK